MKTVNSAIQRLAQAIGYPDEVPEGAASVTFRVDGREMTAVESGGRLVLRVVLQAEPADDLVERLAGYAVGRMLKEEATLAWDPELDALILWQAVPAQAADGVLRRFFEVFATSADWWHARVREDGEVSSIPEMVIRP